MREELKIMTQQLMDQVYRQIKDLEGTFPIPRPATTIKVGTFYAATGNFTGMVSTAEWEPPDEDHHHPVKVMVPPVVEVNAVDVVLEFEVKNPPGGFTVTANGITASAPANQRTVSLNVKDATSVHWTVRSGNKSFSDGLVIERPPIVGAGAFTVAALPLAVVYEPPPDRQKRNKATYSVTKSVGTTISTSFSQEESTTRPTHSAYRSLEDLQKSMKTFASVIEKAPKVPHAAAIAKALQAIAGGLGQVSATQTHGQTVAREDTLALLQMVGTIIDTGENHGGPAIGDIIYYVKNAKLVWLAPGGRLTLALLGYDAIGHIGVDFLKTHLGNTTQTGLDRDTGQALLNLDPFVAGGPEASLSPARFDLVKTYDVRGIDGWHTEPFSQTITQVDRDATTNFTVKLEDYRKGWLSFLGLGVTEDKAVKTTVTHSSSTEATQTITTEVSVTFFGGADEVYSVEVYYDRVFGTFAFRNVSVRAKPVISGTVLNAAGRPLARELVSLTMGDKLFSTHTDKQGRFSFGMSTLKPGSMAVMIRHKVRKALQLKQGAPIQDVVLRLPE
jgi:hypothetical protein